jgi:hypothetical protein
MALFSFGSKSLFRVRSRERDRDTDAARVARLHGFLDELHREIEQERDGLRDRYESVSTRAAFSQQAFEDGRSSTLSTVIDDLTDTMIRYSTRLTALEEQMVFVTELRRQAGAFPHENEGVAASDLPNSNMHT